MTMPYAGSGTLSNPSPFTHYPQYLEQGGQSKANPSKFTTGAATPVISFNTGVANHHDVSATVTLAIPAGVLTNDVMLLVVEAFTETATPPTISFSGGAWTELSSSPQVATAGSTIWSYGHAYYRVATGADPGTTLTITETGSPAGTTWMAASLAAYTGVSTVTPIDVNGGANEQGSISLACPVKVTTVANDWAVFMAAVGLPTNSLSGPAGSTQREQDISASSFVGSAIYDSAASVGGSGTSIGGGNFTAPSSGTWMVAYTVGLAP